MNGSNQVSSRTLYQREWRKLNRAHLSAYAKARRAANPEKYKEQKRRWYKNSIKDGRLAYQRTRRACFPDIRITERYGPDAPAHYAVQAEIQKGVCAICEKLTVGYKEPHRDHNHKTGQLRGLLCARCNKHLGIIEDEQFLQGALSYLARWR